MAQNSKLAGEFIVRLFHARTAAHILHLKTQSYAEHKALNEFYDSVVDLADGFAECYTGEYLEIMQFPTEGYRTPASGMALISGLTSWIKDNREDICDSSECQNIIDEVLSLCHSTAYKLKFLK